MEPFDTLRECLPTWTVAIAALEGVMGLCDREQRTIWIDLGLTHRQQRSTIMHEAIHAIRGDDHDDPDSEHATQVETARRLVDVHALAAAIRASPHVEDILDALDVDHGILRTRIRNLSGDDASVVRRALTGRVPAASPGDTVCAIGRWWRWQRQPEPAPFYCGAGCSPDVAADPVTPPRAPLTLAARLRQAVA